MTPTKQTSPKPVPVDVVPHTEPIDFLAWADRYAALVLRLDQQDRQRREAA